MKVAVIDGQGGGIGRAFVERIRQEIGDEIHILGLGTNALAASIMMKAGANECASGENAVCFNADKVDVILGSLGIIAANSMTGELSAAMAVAVASSPAVKILLPLNNYRIKMAGTKNEPLPHMIDEAVGELKSILEGIKDV
jgi:NAD(P)-dependent dehydrogenase (short-subunit alcohol dehydrogenase family)